MTNKNLIIVTNSKGKAVKAQKNFPKGQVLYSFTPDVVEFDTDQSMPSISVNQRIIQKFIDSKQFNKLFQLTNHYTEFEKDCIPWVDEFATLLHGQQTLQTELLDKEDLKKIIYTFLINQFTSINEYREYNGLALDFMFSLINHSCNPNTTMIYNTHRNTGNKPKYEVIATRDITQNEEIFITYTYSSMPRDIRSIELERRYFFKCRCSRCKKLDPYFSYQCHQCHKILKEFTFESISNDNHDTIACSTCNTTPISVEYFTIYKNIVCEFLGFFGIDLEKDVRIMELLTEFDLNLFQSNNVDLWLNCDKVITSKAISVYCFPINVILSNITLDEPNNLKRLFYLTFGMIENDFDLAYNIRNFILEILETSDSLLIQKVKIVLPFMTELIKGFFKIYNYQIYQELVQLKFNNYQPNCPQIVHELFNEFNITHKHKKNKFLIKLVNDFIDMYAINPRFKPES